MNTTYQVNPYVGPRTFKTTEREFFFGRDREAQDLLSLVISQRLVLFYAQSGAGKSSLVNTKLIPGLVEEKEYKILPVGRILSEAKKEGEAANIYILNLISSLVQYKLKREVLSHLSLSQFFAGLDYEDGQGYYFNEDLPAVPADVPEDTYWKYVLIIDQFEELFTTFPEEWRKREDFFRQLAQALDEFQNLSIVLVMREDYVAVLDPYAHLVPGGFRGRYYMQRLGHHAAVAAVDGPAARQDRPFAAGVAEKLVNDLSSIKVRRPDDTLETQFGQYVEPVQLQVVCSSLWENLPEDCKTITQEHVDLYVVDVDNALGNYYEERVRAVAQSQVARENRVTEHEIRDWFGKKLITPDGIRNMIAREAGRKSGGLEDAVIQEFVRKGDLVRAEKRGGATFYELTHDRLVEPILQNNREWFETNSDLLQSRVTAWIQQGRADSFLLRGSDLRTVRRQAKERLLTDEEQAFIETSVRRERSRMAIWLSIVVAIVAMAVLSFAALQAKDESLLQRAIAVESARDAQRQRAISEEAQLIAEEARQIAEEAQLIAEAQTSLARAQIYQTQPGGLYTSTLLAIDSWRRQPSEEAEEILRDNISFLPIPLLSFEQGAQISALEFDPTGNTFVTTGLDGRACVWNIKEETKQFCTAGTAALIDAIFSPDGKFLLTGDTAGRISILDAKTGALQSELEFGSTSPIRLLDIGPGGNTILIGLEDGNITIVDALNPEEIVSKLAVSGIPTVSRFSPDGGRVAAGTEAGSVVIWDLRNGRVFADRRHRGEVMALSFSPDGRYLISGGRDDYVVAVDTSQEKELFRLPHSGSVREVAFGPDSSWFVTASDDRRLRVWDTATGAERIRMLQDGTIDGLQVSANGQLITTIGSDKTIRLWNVETGDETFQIPLDISGAVVAFSGDGKYLVSGDQQGQIDVWDIYTLATPAKSIQLRGIAENVQYSPSGNSLAVVDENRVWITASEPLSDLSALLQDRANIEFPTGITNLVFSPNSQFIALTTEDNRVAIIDINLPTGMEHFPQSLVKDIAFASDSEQFITLQSNGSVQGSSTDHIPFSTLFLPEGSGVSAISPGPGVLAAGMPDKILILDRKETLAEVDSRGDHTLLAFSPNGALLADANSSGLINIWSYQEGQLTLMNSFHKEQAVSLAFNPDGTLLALGTAKNVFLIESASGQEIARIPHVDLVNDISFSPDGNIMATASSNVLQFWEIGSIRQIKREDLVSEACKRMVRNFSLDQWTEFFGDEPYRPLCEALPVPGE